MSPHLIDLLACLYLFDMICRGFTAIVRACEADGERASRTKDDP